MSKRSDPRAFRRASAGKAEAAPTFRFKPVPVRPRHDGWSPECQTEFIEALAQCGCIEEACARVGKSTASAYGLRQRTDAQSFRQAWEAALDVAIQRLSDAVFGRAINGVSRPVYYQGQQIGERRHYDERLAMFLLRYRDPLRYGAWLDTRDYERAPDAAAILLAKLIDRVADDAWAAEFGDPAPCHRPFAFMVTRTAEDAADEAADRRERADSARRDAQIRADLDYSAAMAGDGPYVPLTSPTFDPSRLRKTPAPGRWPARNSP
jgi:hypothetical protein